MTPNDEDLIWGQDFLKRGAGAVRTAAPAPPAVEPVDAAPADEEPETSADAPAGAEPVPETEAPAAGGRPGQTRRMLLGLLLGLLLLAVTLVALLSGSGKSEQPTTPAASTPVVAQPSAVASTAPARPPLVPAPVRVRAVVKGGRNQLSAAVSSSRQVRARWTLRGPAGRVLASKVLRVGVRPISFTARGLAAGRYSWSLDPQARGVTRSGSVTVTAPPPPPASTTPPVSTSGSSSSSGSTSGGTRHHSSGGRTHGWHPVGG